MIDKLKYIFIKKIYADHNDSKSVKSALSRLVAGLSQNSIGLNIGAGRTKIDPRVKNMEIEPGEGIDFVGSVEAMPFDNNQFDLVITQEVLEHVKSPITAISEIYRVLKPGGHAYIQLPFVIGYHPCPNDYWRFTHEGLEELVKSSNFKILETAFAVGPAIGFYRILVEFLAILTSSLYWRLYKPAKFFFSIACYPIKFLDPIMRRTREANRIPGGYFIICQKP